MTIFWHRQQLIGLVITALLVLSSPANSTTFQPLASITDAVAQKGKADALKHGYKNVEVEVRPLDNRLRLPLCPEPLSTFTSPQSEPLGAVSVGVRCTENKPWTIYVRATVSAFAMVPILKHPMPRNALVTEDDIEMVNRPTQSSTQSIIYEPKKIIGKELTRPLSAGSTLRANYLKEPKVIKRGQQITLIAGAQSLTVRMQGKALKDAAIGERLKVINLSSGQQVEGVANSDGTVTVQ